MAASAAIISASWGMQLLEAQGGYNECMGNPEKSINVGENKALPAPPTAQSLAEVRDYRWTSTAIQGELETLASLPEGESINKPDSLFFASLLRIAAITKGTGRTHVSISQVLEDIKTSCQLYPWLKEKEIERQWKNAYNLANARYRRDDAG